MVQMSTSSAYNVMSSGEWPGLIGPWGVILGGIKLLLMVVDAEQEVGALLTSKAKKLLVEGNKLVINL
jgi:hypothetical protein|nr:hypothetical protein Q903MT_gene1942 [Picea sitchensis]